MSLDPNTPVLVGVGAVSQREEDPARAVEPVELMIRALETAAADAGHPDLLRRADSIRTPQGFWDYSDPGRIVAERIGATQARTCLAEFGVLQTTLLGGAAEDIANGRADVVLVVAGEARHRALRARILGVDAPLTAQSGRTPDRVLRPAAEIFHPEEIRAGLVPPVNQFAMIENALRAADAQSLAAHRDEIAGLWAAMSEVAAANPAAWSREKLAPASIRDPGPGNAMLAFPYTKRHTSQWNVDQAAGLIFCSTRTADRLAIPNERRVHPLAVAEANAMVPLGERGEPGRSPGFAHAGARVFEATGQDPDAVCYRELYSCFPAAVRIQRREIGLSADRPFTVTGGMAFAGGPVNHFVLQALVCLADRLRDDPGSAGLLTAVSGILTKQGVSLWSTQPAPGGFVGADVSAAAAREIPRRQVVPDARGRATVATYTVLYENASPARLALLCDLEDGRRAYAVVPDPELAAQATREEICGRSVRLDGDAPASLD